MAEEKCLTLRDEDVYFVSRILAALVRTINADLPDKETLVLIQDYLYQCHLTEEGAKDLGMLLNTSFFEAENESMH